MARFPLSRSPQDDLTPEVDPAVWLAGDRPHGTTSTWRWGKRNGPPLATGGQGRGWLDDTRRRPGQAARGTRPAAPMPRWTRARQAESTGQKWAKSTPPKMHEIEKVEDGGSAGRSGCLYLSSQVKKTAGRTASSIATH